MSEQDPFLDSGPPLPVLDPDEEAALGAALRAAFAPTALSPERHAALLAFALEDPFAPASADEIRESERLRQALEAGDDSHPEAVLARALRSALSPAALPNDARERAEAAVRNEAAALRDVPEPKSAPARSPARTNVVFVTFGALALAAAAGFALLLTQPSAEPPAATVAAIASAAPAAPALAQSRTTGELFHDRFEAGATTARIDLITTSRERDLRENRYALWGVR